MGVFNDKLPLFVVEFYAAHVGTPDEPVGFMGVALDCDDGGLASGLGYRGS